MEVGRSIRTVVGNKKRNIRGEFMLELEENKRNLIDLKEKIISVGDSL